MGTLVLFNLLVLLGAGSVGNEGDPIVGWTIGEWFFAFVVFVIICVCVVIGVNVLRKIGVL
mgnify:CR=1 FL=1